MPQPKIEEVLGYNASKGKGSETVTRRYYVTADTPTAAKNAFQNYAAALSVPDGLELNDAALDEEKNADGMYFGTITFASPNPKIKTKIADDLSKSTARSYPKTVNPHRMKENSESKPTAQPKQKANLRTIFAVLRLTRIGYQMNELRHRCRNSYARY